MRRIRHHVFAIFRTALGLGLVVYLVVSGTIDGAALMGLAQHWPVAVVAHAEETSASPENAPPRTALDIEA